MKWKSIKDKPKKFKNVLGLSMTPIGVLRISKTCIMQNGEFDEFELEVYDEEHFIGWINYPELPNEKELEKLLKKNNKK